MATLSGSIGYNLRNLGRFSGRDTQGRFWPYAVCVFMLTTAMMSVAMNIVIGKTFERVHRFALEHPEQASIGVGPGNMHISIQGAHPELMPDMWLLWAAIGAINAIDLLLLAAAAARRLHDRDRSGWWGLLPQPFLILGLVLMPAMFSRAGSGDEPTGLFFLLFLNNIVYLGTLVALVVMLASRGTEGPNRFGEPERIE